MQQIKTYNLCNNLYSAIIKSRNKCSLPYLGWSEENDSNNNNCRSSRFLFECVESNAKLLMGL